jgi:predicted N-acyltransferase
LHLQDLQTVLQSNIEAVKPYYVQVVDDKNQTIALVYGQILRILPKFININSLNSSLMWLTKTLLSCKKIQLLVVGHLFRHDAPYMHFQVAITEQEQGQIIQDIIDALEKKYSTTAVFLKDLPKHIGEQFINEPGYNRFKNDVGMELQIHPSWNTFTDYEQALKHKYVQRLRKTQKAFTAVQIKELSLEEITTQKQEIYNLYFQVCKNQNITLGLLNADYFIAFKKSLQENLIVHGFYLENKLIAFSTAILKDQTLDMNYIGFDYSLNSKLQLYFNMLFFFVQQAIERNCKHLFLGRTALEAKAILGCTPVTLCGYYKISNGFLSRATNWFTTKESDEQGELWQSRHPFKSEYYE